MKSRFLTDSLIKTGPYELNKTEKEKLFFDSLMEELKFHFENNKQYRDFCTNKNFDPFSFEGELKEIPSIAVSVFKDLGANLKSVPDNEVKLSLQSSATSGTPSTVVLDKITAKRQAKVMIKVVKDFIGSERKPFIVVDVSPEPKNIKFLGARYAAIGGYLNYSDKVNYALSKDNNNTVSFDIKKTKLFIEALDKNIPVIVFGFTYMLYAQVVKPLLKKGINFELPEGSKIIHIGGWKKLEEKAVSNNVFRKFMADNFNLTNIYNFYGMVEQIGSIFLEGKDGLLYPPDFTEVIIRDPVTWDVLPDGEQGVIQVLSIIPKSYPGHSLLTEDIGRIETITDEGHIKGKGIRVKGRLPKSELRGCSDVIASGQ